ncbi:unnamed protein product [Rotaria sp. Silwood2]|nr:unnamed protein product [Rotaria sp. Silwood2]
MSSKGCSYYSSGGSSATACSSFWGDRDLSGGAIAGIVIGSIVGVLIIVLIVILIIYCVRHNQLASPVNTPRPYWMNNQQMQRQQMYSESNQACTYSSAKNTTNSTCTASVTKALNLSTGAIIGIVIDSLFTLIIIVIITILIIRMFVIPTVVINTQPQPYHMISQQQWSQQYPMYEREDPPPPSYTQTAIFKS